MFCRSAGCGPVALLAPSGDVAAPPAFPSCDPCVGVHGMQACSPGRRPDEVVRQAATMHDTAALAHTTCMRPTTPPPAPAPATPLVPCMQAWTCPPSRAPGMHPQAAPTQPPLQMAMPQEGPLVGATGTGPSVTGVGSSPPKTQPSQCVRRRRCVCPCAERSLTWPPLWYSPGHSQTHAHNGGDDALCMNTSCTRPTQTPSSLDRYLPVCRTLSRHPLPRSRNLDVGGTCSRDPRLTLVGASRLSVAGPQPLVSQARAARGHAYDGGVARLKQPPPKHPRAAWTRQHRAPEGRRPAGRQQQQQGSRHWRSGWAGSASSTACRPSSMRSFWRTPSSRPSSRMWRWTGCGARWWVHVRLQCRQECMRACGVGGGEAGGRPCSCMLHVHGHAAGASSSPATLRGCRRCPGGCAVRGSLPGRGCTRRFPARPRNVAVPCCDAPRYAVRRVPFNPCSRLQTAQGQFLAYVFGGTASYTGRELAAAHRQVRATPPGPSDAPAPALPCSPC